MKMFGAVQYTFVCLFCFVLFFIDNGYMSLSSTINYTWIIAMMDIFISIIIVDYRYWLLIIDHWWIDTNIFFISIYHTLKIKSNHWWWCKEKWTNEKKNVQSIKIHFLQHMLCWFYVRMFFGKIVHVLYTWWWWWHKTMCV